MSLRISVVFPAPRKPEKMSIFVMLSNLLPAPRKGRSCRLLHRHVKLKKPADSGPRPLDENSQRLFSTCGIIALLPDFTRGFQGSGSFIITVSPSRRTESGAGQGAIASVDWAGLSRAYFSIAPKGARKRI